jgi:ferredoxin, 2Fe-2S
MPTLKITAPSGKTQSVDVGEGKTVMEAIRDSGFDELLALCGGGCSCGTCHVYVDEKSLNRLPAMSNDENDLLDGSSHRRDNSRLSCQLQVTSDLDGIAFNIAPQD